MRPKVPLVFAPLAALLFAGACGRTVGAPPATTPSIAASTPNTSAPSAASSASAAPAAPSASAASVVPLTPAATPSPSPSARAPSDERCTACCEEESRSCDADCAPGEAGRGCLRRCGSRRVSCFQGCAGGPDDFGCRKAASRPGTAASNGPVTVPCVSDADCWYDDASGRAIPARRPSALRGQKIRPCVDRESVPACRNGACTLLRYKC